jgi:hypothetical protein
LIGLFEILNALDCGGVDYASVTPPLKNQLPALGHSASQIAFYAKP